MYINKIKKIQLNFKNHLLKMNNKESDSKKKIYPDKKNKIMYNNIKKSNGSEISKFIKFNFN